MGEVSFVYQQSAQIIVQIIALLLSKQKPSLCKINALQIEPPESRQRAVQVVLITRRDESILTNPQQG